MERPKLEMELNQPKTIKLLFDEAIVGESQYGKYYLYAVSNGENKEYSFFAPDEVHEILKDHSKGTLATITKVAMQKGSKLVTSYKVDIVNNSICSSENGAINSQTGPYLEMMIRSFEDAIKIQERFNGIANINQIAITMFIQRTKGNGFSHEQN